MKIYYEDMKDAYEETVTDNPLIYEYYPILEETFLHSGLTIIHPGTIGHEFFMTRGHRHIYQTSEIYYCESGEGILYEITESGKEYYHNLIPGQLVYVAPGSLHRVINTGDIDLRITAIYGQEVPKTYEVHFTHRFLVP